MSASARVTEKGKRATAEASRSRRAFKRALAKKHPPFFAAVLADARYASANLGRPMNDESRIRVAREALRLTATSDAFIGLVLYRAKARLQGLRIPGLPRVAHRLAIALAQVSIGDPVVIAAGVYIPHGQVVVDGIVSIGKGTTLRPWVTVGLKEGNFDGPKIGRGVSVGTGAKIIGPVKIGDGASIGANAVVLIDVPARATAVGVPARILGS